MEMKAESTGGGSIHIIGLGVRVVMQLTLESNYALGQMEHVFHLEDDPAVTEYISSLGCEEHNLRPMYQEGKLRDQVYQEISDTIVGAAGEGKKCAYLAPGNPVFINSISLKIRESAHRCGIPVFVYPGVSSIDTLLSELFAPFALTGFQCFEATHFVRMKPNIDRRVPLLLFQPAIVEARDIRHVAGAYIPGVELLRNLLIEIYGTDQKWMLLRSAMSGGDRPMLSVGVLSELVDKSKHLELGTLVIPGDWDCDEYIKRNT